MSDGPKTTAWRWDGWLKYDLRAVEFSKCISSDRIRDDFLRLGCVTFLMAPLIVSDFLDPEDTIELPDNMEILEDPEEEDEATDDPDEGVLVRRVL